MHAAAVEAEAKNCPARSVPPGEFSVMLVRAGCGLSELEARKLVAAVFAAPDMLRVDVVELFD